MFGGKQLKDERGVVVSGVEEWSTLHLSLRLCGGATTQRKTPSVHSGTLLSGARSHMLKSHGFDSSVSAEEVEAVIGENTLRQENEKKALIMRSTLKRFSLNRNIAKRKSSTGLFSTEYSTV